MFLNVQFMVLISFILSSFSLQASKDNYEDLNIEKNSSKYTNPSQKSHMESLSPNRKVISFLNEGQYIEALDYVKAQNGSRYEIIRIISDPILQSENPDFKGEMKAITTNKEEIKFKWQFESMLEQTRTIPATVFGKAGENYFELVKYATKTPYKKNDESDNNSEPPRKSYSSYVFRVFSVFLIDAPFLYIIVKYIKEYSKVIKGA